MHNRFRQILGMIALAALFLGSTMTFERAHADYIGPLTLPAEADTFVASGKPDDAHGKATGLWVGRVPDYGVERAYLRFDVATPPGTEIRSARLRLYLGGASTGDPPMTVRVQRITQDWEEAVLTWTHQENWDAVGSMARNDDVRTDLGWYEWDVSELLKEWIADDKAGDAISFRVTGDEEEGEHERGFWSKDCFADYCSALHPQLVLTLTWPHGAYLPLIVKSDATR
jgi:hypothetical protein